MPLIPLLWLGGGAAVSWASSFFGEKAAKDDSQKWLYIGGAIVALILIVLLFVWLK